MNDCWLYRVQSLYLFKVHTIHPIVKVWGLRKLNMGLKWYESRTFLLHIFIIWYPISWVSCIQYLISCILDILYPALNILFFWISRTQHLTSYILHIIYPEFNTLYHGYNISNNKFPIFWTFNIQNQISCILDRCIQNLVSYILDILYPAYFILYPVVYMFSSTTQMLKSI